MSKSNPKVCIAYIRVSTDTNKQELGAEAQRQSIEKWAAASKVDVVEWFVEEVTGGASLDKRPIFLRALAAVAEHRAGCLVVQRLDRFSRDPLTGTLAEIELSRHGATLAVTEGAGSGSDPTSEMVRGILLVVARFEKAMIVARIKAALAVKMARGEFTGTAPYGKQVGADGKTLEVNHQESAKIVQLKALRASGLSIRAVLAEATKKGILNRVGKPFTVAATHAILHQEVQ